MSLWEAASAAEAAMGRLTHRTHPAGTYFVTTKTWGNRALFQIPEAAQIVTDCIASCRERGSHLLHEFVLMPDHLHLLLTPGVTTSLERAVQLIKGGSSHAIHAARGHNMQIWQPGFHEWTVRDNKDYKIKREYIWMNPVRAGLTGMPEEWPHGSASGRFGLDPAPENLSG